MNTHHRRALALLAATLVLDVVFGTWFGIADGIGIGHGLYCATGFATTEGCDVQPHGWLAYTLGALMMISMVPLFTAVFSFFTTGLTASHIDTMRGGRTWRVRTGAGPARGTSGAGSPPRPGHGAGTGK